MRRSALVVLIAAALFTGTVNTLPAEAATISAKSLLAKLPVAAEAGARSYTSTSFRRWIDADRDSCDTREEVLLAESVRSVRRGAGCRILSGRWFSPYDGRTWTRPSDLEIDHMVPLKEAWESGARRWSSTTRMRFANDLGFGWSLDAMTDNLKASKAAQDPGRWLPPRAKCRYARHWVAVKYRWRLTIDRAEKAKLASVLTGTCGARTFNIPRRMTVAASSPSPSPTSSGGSTPSPGATSVTATGPVPTSSGVSTSPGPTTPAADPTPASTPTVVTPPPPPVTVMAVGDIACPPGTAVTATRCRHGDVARTVAASGTDYLIPLGDLQYNSGTYAEFMGAGAYDSAFSALKSRTLPVIGNHEHVDPAGIGQGYFDYFYGPSVNTGSAGTRGKGFYTRMLGAWQFIALNSECSSNAANGNHPLPGGCGVGSEQYQWLASVLSSSTAQCTLVAYHRPRWTTGAHQPYAAMAPMWDLMASAGVDVAVSGHNHSSEVFRRIGVSGASAMPVINDTGGIRSFVAGGGGMSLYPFTDSSSAVWQAALARDSTTFGPLRLTLNDGSFDWQFTPAISGRSFTNVGTSGSFSGTGEPCHS